MGTLKLNRNSNGTKNSAEVAEAVKRAGSCVKAAVKKDFAAEALNLAAQCGLALIPICRCRRRG